MGASKEEITPTSYFERAPVSCTVTAATLERRGRDNDRAAEEGGDEKPGRPQLSNDTSCFRTEKRPSKKPQKRERKKKKREKVL